MATRFFRKRADGGREAVGLDQLLSPLLERQGGAATLDELSAYVIAELNADRLEMDPSAQALRDLVVAGRVQDWTSRTVEAGAARFLSDRRGGRFDRRAGLVAQLLDLRRLEFVASIRESLEVQGPAMYRSQSYLLAELDPGLDAAALAAECSARVAEAVREGVAAARAAALGPSNRPARTGRRP